MVEVTRGTEASYKISTHEYTGRKDKNALFTVQLHLDFSNCGLCNAHFPTEHGPGGWEALYEFLYNGRVPDKEGEFYDKVAIFRFSGTNYGDVNDFYKWCEEHHPGVMTRDEWAHNPNSGNKIACYNFYSNIAEED